MLNNKKGLFGFTISGFIIAIVLIALYSASFGVFMSELDSEYDTSSNISLTNYGNTSAIIDHADDIRESTNIEQQDQKLFDIVGGYFSAGYSALKTSLLSFGLFENMMSQASDDVPVVGFFQSYLLTILIIGLFVGVVLTVLVKMRI